MLYHRKQLPELNNMKHMYDNVEYLDYENNILNKSLTPHLYTNDVMNGYLIRLQPLISLFFDQINIVKNMKNYKADKYEFR